MSVSRFNNREFQLVKGPIIDSVNEMKSCLEILIFSLPKIKVKKNITDQEKYDYIFSVDTLNQEVLAGKPFRDAYRELGHAIEKNDFNPLTQLIEILKDPYTQKDAIFDYQIPSNSDEKYQTFCGT